MPFFDKELSKAIMTRTKTCNNLLKSKGEENKKVYANQRNVCVPHFRKIKNRYYWNLFLPYSFEDYEKEHWCF